MVSHSRNHLRKATGAWLGVLLISPLVANSQTIDERSPLDDYQGPPSAETQTILARVGPLSLLPSAAVVAAYDSNVLAASEGGTGQAVAIGETVLRVATEPGLVEGHGGGFVRGRRFSKNSEQNTTEFGVSADVSWKPTEQDHIGGRFSAQRRFEPRTEIESPNSGRPSLYDDADMRLSYARMFNRLSIDTFVEARRIEYVGASERYRDRYSYLGDTRAGYELRSGLSVVASAYYGRDDFDLDGISAMSASSIGGLAGFKIGRPDIIDVELSAGMFHRNVARGLGDLSGVALRGTVNWYVTRLTTIRAELTREDQPTRLLGALGKVRSDGRIEVSHDYSTNLVVYARGRLVNDDFEDAGLSGTTVSADVGVKLQLSRKYELQVEHDYVTRNFDVVGESFDRHVLSLSFVGRL